MQARVAEASDGASAAPSPASLASAHRDVSPGEVFLPRDRLRKLELALEAARTALPRRALEGPARTAAEWFFDNDYLVRRAVHQVRDEFPAEFQRHLPTLRGQGEPRALVVARAIHRAGCDLDTDALDGFLTAYQSETSLTIAELWALPILIRWVVLDDVAGVLSDLLKPTPVEGYDPGTALGRSIGGLRLFSQLDIKSYFCRHSATERLLESDPAGAYERMDFETRDAYRGAVEEIAASSGRTEEEVVQGAIDRARASAPDGRHDHVGYWLLGPGRASLYETMGARPRGVVAWIRRAPRLSFFGLLVVSELALLTPVLAYLVWIGASAWLSALAVLLCWIPSTVPAVTFAYWLLAELVPPRPLLKMDFAHAIPRRFRTLVVVPTLLDDETAIDELLERLEVHFLTDPDPELGFALLTDHVDLPTAPGDDERRRLEHAKRGVRALNARHGRAGPAPFHLLHRESRWNPAESRWMGWERKRGKLEELNRLLRGDTQTSFEVHEGDPDGLRDVAFVLTLDSDTQLSPAGARRLVGALAHPLNRPVFDERGRVTEGYTVIQPRVAIAPRSARRSVFTRLFTGDVGIDIYTRAISEVYQDLFGEGIYVGKGIYDVDGFSRALHGRVPENRLVSHDLFEGVHGRSALATDVVVYEDYPPHYLAHLRRMHRWVRGDWQLLPWLAPWVPTTSGLGRTRLGLVDRFKILDNLRRSLLSPAILALVLAGWFILPGHPAFWTVAALLAPGAAAIWGTLQTTSLRRDELGRWILALCFAASESAVVLDAVTRVLFRTFVTRRRMLEWTTAAHVARTMDNSRRTHLRALWAGPAVALAVGGLLAWTSPWTLWAAGPVLLLWLLSPEIAQRISRPIGRRPAPRPVDAVPYARQVARRTWLFFETFVGPGDQWLPPDHFQEEPRGRVAHRTSPTNIGLLLLSELSAYDLGYLSIDELATWVDNTLTSVEKLERHRGHVFNWIDTQTLTPLEPRYVSTVDSGNLAAALMALAVGCERAAQDTPARAATREGLRDTVGLLIESLQGWVQLAETVPAHAALEAARALLDAISAPDPMPLSRETVRVATQHLEEVETLLLGALRTTGEGQDEVAHAPVLLLELKTWLERLEDQLREALRTIEQYRTDETGQVALEALPAVCAALAASKPEAAEGLDLARAAAQRVHAQLHGLAMRARALAEAMELGFLYDERRRLFHIGYDVSADRYDPHHYDLLASEARIASFLAVMRREVPMEHWFAMGRPLAASSPGAAMLLSWGGSMFEYLMPTLLMRSHPDTLLSLSCEAAIEVQMAHGRAHGEPWGVSESGYAFLDGQEQYQYRSFGVPGLGLRRGLAEDRVVAPYATLLALPLRPAEAVTNLRRLEATGMLGRYGFFEALDFHPERAHGRPTVVRSYMAHHHGMSLVALDNFLHADLMVERFHADPRVESVALLLDERAPRRAPRETPSEAEMPTADVALVPTPPVPGWEPSVGADQIWAFGNGATSTLISAAGGGGLRFRGLAATRWEPDPVADEGGAWIYVTDAGTGEVFGATPAPTGDWPEEGRVRFEPGGAEFLSRRGDLRVHLRVAVSPTEDVELRELQLANDGDEPRALRVVACVEPVLEPVRAAGQHPAFSRLFLRRVPAPGVAGFLVTRSPREGPPAPALFFASVGDSETQTEALEVDRESFLGRWGSYARPAGLSALGVADEAGATLDPICACAATLTIHPGTARTVAFITGVAPSVPEATDVARRFSSLHAVRWGMEDAARMAARWTAESELPGALFPAAQRLFSALLVPDRDLRADERTATLARPNPQRLWGRGISGDEPIVTLELSSQERPEILGALLAMHRLARRSGVRFDLVLVDHAPSGYGEQGPSRLERWLADGGVRRPLHQRGGVHIVRADQTSGEDLMDLRAAARVALEAESGAEALARLSTPPLRSAELPRFEPAGPPPETPDDPEVRLDPDPPLELDNGLGGFHDDAYVIRPGARLPAPWCNVIANPGFGCLTSEGGLGSTWSLNAKENRLTPWRNDPVTDVPSEVLYLRDEETGAYWSTTPRPVGVPTRVEHGAGYTTYTLVCHGLHQEMVVFVPPELPVKVVRLRISNRTPRPRRVTATYYAEWVLGSDRLVTRPHVRSELAGEVSTLLAHNPWSFEHGDRVAFAGCDAPLHGHTADRREMLGPGGDLSRPAALTRWGLSGRTGPGLDPCAALQVHVDLTPGQTHAVCFFLGQAEGADAARSLAGRLREPGEVEAQWAECRHSWNRRLAAIEVRTPDPRMDRLLNRWLLQQSLASRVFGRAAFYQSSGAFGFRDQLQDSLAAIHVDPGLTRQLVLQAAAHQFEQGDVLHWWHPPGGAGVRTRCSDDLLWLVYVTADYVRATGDVAVLDEPVPFLLGDELGAGEDARYGRFAKGAIGSLLEHCRRALLRGFTAGPHGLPLIGDGDWNDGMNCVGREGRGESVWLGWFLHVCTERFADLLERVDDPAEAARWRDRLPALRSALEEHAWDGDWYRRAYHDDGLPIGSAHTPPPHIDSIAQSWAAISGAGDPERVTRALASAERLLVRPQDRLVLLLAPPFGRAGANAGYIASYPPGVRENGGQYTHAAVWLGWAHAKRRDGAAAHRIFDLLNPLSRTATAEGVERYRVEPYVIAADIYGRPPFVGRGGWTWYTGAAAWTWRLGVEAILGLRWEDGALVVEPCIPPSWSGFEAWVRRGDATVHVVVRAPADGADARVVAVTLDGRPVAEARVTLPESGIRELEVELGRSVQAGARQSSAR